MQGWPRFLAIFLMLVPGVLLAVPVGALIESTFFSGDIQAWLDGRVGSGVGGWMIPLFPGALLATAVVGGRLLGPWMRNLTAGWDRHRCALFDLGRFLVAAAVALGLAWVLSLALAGMGFDPRGSYLDTYVQRNALVVGLVMGFAIIPIIYTIAEDALSSVPEHLRLASLGAGATPWQTAVRVIVPTAMSGLFSALMIGLGRAVGETMIVLMATGNTPVMNWNVFSGFRTLSANIAVELPEAVRNSTHYRTLFLAALCLFVMTFALNTVAEVIRQRFRKRAFQL
jgi:phosphate transport system permease protein